MPNLPIVTRVRELQARADRERAAGRRIALVPTMGALHAGHLSLVAEARKHADSVWMSIFVNPTQFNDPKDFEGYPVDTARDLALAAEQGVDVVFCPTAEELYPEGAQTWVDVQGLTDCLCGASRPGHFRGVTTVVAKLLLAARPHVAVFGQKDFQQCAVIRRMVSDLGFGVEIVAAPTVREPDGLALSSRNVHLGPEARLQALSLVRALDAAEAAVARGETDRAGLLAKVRAEIDSAPLAALDYAELCDPDTLEPAPPQLAGASLLALAVEFSPDAPGRGGRVRLIDNRVLGPSPSAQ
jgi:pantoate--beta-alanine ligase